MKRLCLLFMMLCAVSSLSQAKIVCEGGVNRFGEWVSCLDAHYEPGLPEGRRPIDANRVGQVEKVHKNLDGSVTVWRHGTTDTEEWTQIDKDTWERKR